MARAPIAKVCAPRLFSVVPRARLFDRLDQNRGRPLIWLDSPPGSGKSTLARELAKRLDYWERLRRERSQN